MMSTHCIGWQKEMCHAGWFTSTTKVDFWKESAPGIYKKAGDLADWSGIVRLLQEELDKSVHVSGRTALELAGGANFGNLSDHPNIFLTTYDSNKLPAWLTLVCNLHRLILFCIWFTSNPIIKLIRFEINPINLRI